MPCGKNIFPYNYIALYFILIERSEVKLRLFLFFLTPHNSHLTPSHTLHPLTPHTSHLHTLSLSIFLPCGGKIEKIASEIKILFAKEIFRILT